MESTVSNPPHGKGRRARLTHPVQSWRKLRKRVNLFTSLLGLVPTMHPVLAHITVVALAVGTAAYITHSIFLLYSHGRVQHNGLDMVSEIQTGAFSFEELIKKIDHHPRPSKSPLVSCIRTILGNGGGGLIWINEGRLAYWDLIQEEMGWYFYRYTAPSAIVFAIVMILNTSASGSFPVNSYPENLLHEITVFWAANLIFHVFRWLNRKNYATKVFWMHFSEILERLLKEHDCEALTEAHDHPDVTDTAQVTPIR